MCLQRRWKPCSKLTVKHGKPKWLLLFLLFTVEVVEAAFPDVFSAACVDITKDGVDDWIDGGSYGHTCDQWYGHTSDCGDSGRNIHKYFAFPINKKQLAVPSTAVLFIRCSPGSVIFPVLVISQKKSRISKQNPWIFEKSEIFENLVFLKKNKIFRNFDMVAFHDQTRYGRVLGCFEKQKKSRVQWYNFCIPNMLFPTLSCS